MILSRRRFLTISAAVPFASGADAQSNNAHENNGHGNDWHGNDWHGRAFGADVSISITGAARDTAPILARAKALLYDIEAEFNLYDPASSLSQLNRTGKLRPSANFARLMAHADRIHRATGGLFEPSVQPQWRALADGRDLPRPIGWEYARHGGSEIQLARGQQLTFNGIAQGFATDLIATLLQEAGLHNTLVNIGEYRGVGGPWRLAISDPQHGQLATRSLTSGAIATSSPTALRIGDRAHILHPTARPKWSTISVEADSATCADGFSTALTLADTALLEQLVGTHGITRITAIDTNGDLTSFT